jgi:tRNA(Ile)-lysidine synthase TilS/MesJ
LLCEVDPVPNIRVELITRPLCLKWRSETEEALTKKARGVTSLWANAARQIPDGEIGFIYIAYPE